MAVQERSQRPKTAGIAHVLMQQVQKGGIILLVLLTLSSIGIGITDFSPAKALWYWIAMAPVFGGVCVYLEWTRSSDKEKKTPFQIVRRQVIHWVGFLASIYLVFLLHSTGRLNDADAGLVALLTLAMSAFFAGLHSDWRICVVGIVLASAVAGAALVEEFFWMLIIPLVVAAAVGIVWWRYRSRPPEGL